MNHTKLTNEKIEEILRSAHEQEPWVSALNQILDEEIMDESRQALLPDLHKESRAYNCGRAAAIFDFKMMLVEKGLKLA